MTFISLPGTVDSIRAMLHKRYASRLVSIVFLMCMAAFARPAAAGVCDFAPSKLIRAGGWLAAGTAVAGAGLKASGLYTLTHSVTGATMLGSTAAGSSAAGTVGIIEGTAGLVGSAAAALMSPAVITTASLAASGVLVLEGACYFANKSK